MCIIPLNGNFKESIKLVVNKLSSFFINKLKSPKENQKANLYNNNKNNELDKYSSINLTQDELLSGTIKTLTFKNESIDIKIPAGIKPNQKLRLKGKGNIRISNGERGDLYLEVRISQSSNNTNNNSGVGINDDIKDSSSTKVDRIIRITIINAGGEYTGGSISNNSSINNIKQSILNGNIQSIIDFPNGESFDATDYDDIFHFYGPELGDELAEVLIEETSDLTNKNDWDKNYKIIYSGKYVDSKINEHNTCNPSAWKEMFIGFGALEVGETKYFDKNDLLIFNYKLEKRIHYSVSLKLEKGEKFKLGCLNVGCFWADELFPSELVPEYVLYIPERYNEMYCKEYLYKSGSLDKGEFEEYKSFNREEVDEFSEMIFNEFHS
mgnify:CR=1 FL=1